MELLSKEEEARGMSRVRGKKRGRERAKEGAKQSVHPSSCVLFSSTEESVCGESPSASYANGRKRDRSNFVPSAVLWISSGPS